MRLKLSVAIALSTLPGFVTVAHGFTFQAVAVFFGVLFLSMAASVLNQILERNQDALMERTHNRALPLGQVTLFFSVALSISLVITALIVLFFWTTTLATLLGMFNLLWYLGFYTPLKRKTSFAFLIGGITGAIPPIIGAAAAGNPLLRPVVFIATFMFFWQTSHFLLLLTKYGKEYECAGFRAVISILSVRQFNVVFFISNLLMVSSTFLFLSSLPTVKPSLIALLAILNCVFLGYNHTGASLTFMVIYQLSVLTLFSASIIYS